MLNRFSERKSTNKRVSGSIAEEAGTPPLPLWMTQRNEASASSDGTQFFDLDVGTATPEQDWTHAGEEREGGPSSLQQANEMMKQMQEFCRTNGMAMPEGLNRADMEVEPEKP